MKKPLICFSLLLGCLSAYAQDSRKVDFMQLEADLRILPQDREVEGDLVYTFDVLELTDSVFIDAQKMEFEGVELNGEQISFTNNGKRIGIGGDFQPSTGNKLRFSYKARPGQTMYFVGWDTAKKASEAYPPQVWTQGQGKFTSHWLPSFDDTREKLEFDLSISFDQDFEVIANGALLEKTKVKDSLQRWEYDMQEPMSSYLLAVAIGKYEVEERLSTEGTPLRLYYYPKDRERVEPTYRHTREMFDFLEEEIGVAYPWQNYKQIPVRNFLHSGMENTGTTIFSDFFMTDSIAYKDRNYVMVNAHEMAHQWFGNLVTAESGEDHWLQEGLSTYYALLAEREMFGEDYYYWQLFESAERLKEMSDRGEGEAVMSKGAGSLTYYQKGAWALHMLHEKVGTQAFREAVRSFLLKHQFQNASSEDFMGEMENASGMDLSAFSNTWLRQSAFPAAAALASLQKSDFIQEYLEIAALKEIPLSQKRDQLKQALQFPVNDYIGQEVVHQLALERPSDALDLYKLAFDTENLMVRQAIAITLMEIPTALKSEYQSLLEDESYLTKEAALYHLWMAFPSERQEYLESLRGVEGFYDKNVEILWLSLNLATPDYDSERQKEVYEKLLSYTEPAVPFYIRQNAFRFLLQLNAFNETSLANLMEGTQHQVWRFNTFSREMLGELLNFEHYREMLQGMMPDLSLSEREYLRKELK